MNIKNKKLTERLTLSEKWHVCRRVLVEMRRMSPAFFPATLIRQLLEVSRGYLGIYVSSEVLSGLERGVPARSLIMKTGFMLGAIFVFSLLACWLQSYSNRVKDQVYDLLAGSNTLPATYFLLNLLFGWIYLLTNRSISKTYLFVLLIYFF